MSLNGKITLSTNITNQKVDTLATASEAVFQNISKDISTGRLYHSQLELSAGLATEINLGDGSLDDIFGDAITLSGVTSMYIKADSLNADTVIISGATNSILNTQPEMAASEGIGFLADIDITTDSKLYFTSAVSGYVDVIITGD